MFLPSANKYVWVSNGACGILFLYEKQQRSKYKLLGNSAVDGPSFRSEKMVNETTKNDFFSFFYLKNLCTSFFLIKFYELRCQNPFED